FKFKGKSVDVPQVARQLKVGHILEGSVRKAGGRVRITAQLIEGETGGAARQLKGGHILEGSVRKAGGRVRITAQLIEGETGGHVWAERYDRDLNDLFALPAETPQRTVPPLKLKLLPEEKRAIEKRGT